MCVIGDNFGWLNKRLDDWLHWFSRLFRTSISQASEVGCFTSSTYVAAITMIKEANSLNREIRTVMQNKQRRQKLKVETQFGDFLSSSWRSLEVGLIKMKKCLVRRFVYIFFRRIFVFQGWRWFFPRRKFLFNLRSKIGKPFWIRRWSSTLRGVCKLTWVMWCDARYRLLSCFRRPIRTASIFWIRRIKFPFAWGHFWIAYLNNPLWILIPSRARGCLQMILHALYCSYSFLHPHLPALCFPLLKRSIGIFSSVRPTLFPS